VQELPGPAHRVDRLGAARHRRGAGVQLPRFHHHQHLLPGGVDHAGGTDRDKRHPDRAVRQYAAVAGYGEARGDARSTAHPAPALFREDPQPLATSPEDHPLAPAPEGPHPLSPSPSGRGGTQDKPAVSPNYWNQLGDTTLSRLVDEVLRANLDVRSARARVS